MSDQPVANNLRFLLLQVWNADDPMRGHEIDCFSRSLPCASCTSSPSPRSASCWGFQAMARAMGAEVVTDHSFAEVGTIWLELTPEVKQDPVFGPLGDRFQVQIGHEDIMTKLPPGATLLASSGTVRNGAFRFDGKPIYCTQFHPELDREGLVLRIAAYPEYLPLTGHRTLEELDPRRCRCRDRVRMGVAQAREEGLTLVSRDEVLPQYDVRLLRA